MGMDTNGLRTFFIANIKSIISYACLAWYNVLSDTDKTRLERTQRSATRIVLPFSDNYEQRLDHLALPPITTFLHTTCSEHFTKKADDNRPFNSRIKINTNRKSARRAKIDIIYRLSKCRTTKRHIPFLNFICDFSTKAAQTLFIFIFPFMCRTFDAINLSQDGY